MQGTEIEGGDDPGVDVQYPWEDSPRRFHEQEMQIKPFFIDKFPVTNAQFKQFLDATHYAPSDALNFLRDWKNGTYPAGLGQPAGDLGFSGRCARLCQVGRQAPAPRVGMAICRAGHRWPHLSMGQSRGKPRERAHARSRAAPCAAPTRSTPIPREQAPTA